MPIPPRDIDLLVTAIDSHIYWHLADASYRNDGGVIEPASDDPDTRAQIAEYRALAARLQALPTLR